MNPMAFVTTWMLGAASTGNKQAEQILHEMYPTLVAECSYYLEVLRSGYLKRNNTDVRDGLKAMLGGFEKKDGETCLACIIRYIRTNIEEHVARACMASSMKMNKGELLSHLKDLVKVLEDDKLTSGLGQETKP